MCPHHIARVRLTHHKAGRFHKGGILGLPHGCNHVTQVPFVHSRKEIIYLIQSSFQAAPHAGGGGKLQLIDQQWHLWPP